MASFTFGYGTSVLIITGGGSGTNTDFCYSGSLIELLCVRIVLFCVSLPVILNSLPDDPGMISV